MGFKIEDLALGKMDKQQFQIDYMPMWKMLDEWERKTPNGFKNVEMKAIFERIYEYAIVSSGIDKADSAHRVERLNSENLKWFVKSEALEKENTLLRQKLQEKQLSNES